MQIDPELSRRVAGAIPRQRAKGWQNCWRAVRTLPDLVDASYVEGWAVTGDLLAIEHAWIEVNGRIVDPTFLRTGRGISYHPALCVGCQTVQQMGPRFRQRWPFAHTRAGDDSTRERYRTAQETALAESRDEAVRRLVVALQQRVGFLPLAGGPSAG